MVQSKHRAMKTQYRNQYSVVQKKFSENTVPIPDHLQVKGSGALPDPAASVVMAAVAGAVVPSELTWSAVCGVRCAAAAFLKKPLGWEFYHYKKRLVLYYNLFANLLCFNLNI